MRRLGAVRKFHARGHQYHILTRSGHGQFIIAVVGVGTSPPNSAIRPKRASGLVSTWLDHRSLKHSPSDKRERDAPPRLHANVLDGWLASQTRYVVHVKLRCVETRF
jgi:hypothetical protein